MSAARQTAIGLALAALIVGSWLTLQLFALFGLRLGDVDLLLLPLIVAVLCWLNVGLFIVAHDAMHGSLAPGRPRLNRAVGRVALSLYALFSFDRLRPQHFAHHEAPGTDADPDFHGADPRRFVPWYQAFIRRYFGLAQLGMLAIVVAALLVLGAPLANVLLLWALPAILSSLQLFYFGTYRPHRHEAGEFADDHRARSTGFSWLASLLSCYHFGYHHEHHLAPHVPWWRLPAERRARAPVR